MTGAAALLARGIWWRRGASLVLVLCAAVTVGGAAAGPLWGRAAEASLLTRTLQDAPVSELAWTVTGGTANYGGLVYPPPAPGSIASDVRAEGALPPDLDGLFDAPTETVSTARRLQVASQATDRRPALGNLVGRDGACEQVELVAGACPAQRNELLLSDRSAAELDVGIGDPLRIPELRDEPPPPGLREAPPFVVAGVYRSVGLDARSRFWFDGGVLEYAPPTSLGGETLPARLDAVLVRPDFIRSLQTFAVTVRQERVLRPGAVTLENTDRVTARLTATAAELAGRSRVVRGESSAATTLARTVRGRELVADTATFVGLQVVVFGWVVLFGLVAVSVASRDAELALAKLRGLRGRRLAAHTLTEPLALVLLAVPLGLAGAWAAAGVLARRLLMPGTPVAASPGVWWAVGATAAGSVLACVLAARRSWRMPVAEQLRRQSPQPGAAGGIATAVLLTLATVGLVLVLTLGRSAESALPALLTPVVVGLAAGLVVGAAVQVLLRAAANRTHRWPLGPYLAVRQLARRRSLTHTTALVTVAVAVSGFAAGAFAVTTTQRESQARIDVGAERVVHVAPVTAPDLIGATREADPRGGWAMAAVERGEGTGGLLAVDSARFGAVFGVPGGALAGPRALAELVPADVPEPLLVRGTSVTARVGGFARAVTESGTVNDAEVRVGLQLRVVTTAGDVRPVALGTLGPSPATLTAALPACAQGCTVASVYLVRTAGLGEISGSLDLLSLEIGGTAYPFSDAEWRPALVDESVPDSATTSSLRGLSGDGVAVTFAAPSSVTPGIVRRDVPTELPAILGDGTALSLVGTRQLVWGRTLEGGDLPFSVAGRTPAVPRSGEGSIVDLGLVSRIEPPRSSGLDFQVWLGGTAPPGAPELLAAAGLQVLDVETRAARRDALDRAEPARAQLLLLAAGAAVLLAGVAGIATVLAAAARRRAAESAALHAMAVPGRVVRGSAVLEDVLLLLPGVLAGAACAAALVTALTPVLAEVTGAAAVVSGAPAVADVLLPVLAAAAVTVVLLVPVVVAVTRPAGDESTLRAAT